MSVTEALLLSLMKLAAPISYPKSLEKNDIDDKKNKKNEKNPKNRKNK
jgi:hypothetical protein